MKILLLCLLAASASLSPAQTPTPATAPAVVSATGIPHIAPGSRIFIEEMGGFETYLAAAMLKKKVPIIVVDDKAKADWIVTGTSHNDKAGWAKTIFISGASSAGASIAIKNPGGDLGFAYSVDKYNSARGNQSTAEACAKHLKEAIEKK